MKYIVEFEDEPCMYEDDVHFYKCIQAPWWGLSERVIEQLTPYQPDAPDTNVGNITNSCDHEKDHTADSSKMVCVDAISRQETIHAISDWIYDTTDERLPEQVIRSLPAVQPAGKQGHWEVYFVLMSTHGDVEDEKCHCSECGREGVLWWNFCPNCGADMRGEQDEAD